MASALSIGFGDAGEVWGFGLAVTADSNAVIAAIAWVIAEVELAIKAFAVPSWIPTAAEPVLD